MGRLKDILYDKSDILVALVILIIAGAIIWNRIDAIMAYSSVEEDAIKSGKAASSQTKNTKDASKKTSTDNKNKPNDNESDSKKEDSNDKATVKGETVRIDIENDDASDTIARKLVDAGLVDSADQFIKAVKKQDAETKLRSGRFDIEKGSSPEKIVTLLTTTYGV